MTYHSAARDSLISRLSPDPYHVGPFEEMLIELGPRAYICEVEENDGWPFWHPWQDEPELVCDKCGGTGRLRERRPKPWYYEEEIRKAG